MRRIERLRDALLVCCLLVISPAFCLAAPDDLPSAGCNALKAVSVSTAGESVDSNAAPEPRPAPKARSGDSGLIGVGIRLSTLGAGVEVGVSLTNKLNVRGGFNIFQYSRGFNHDGIAYKGQLNLRSGEAHVDFYPIGHTFHLSPGLLIYNGNGATATANVPGGSSFTLGGTTYTSDPTNPITGTGKLDFVKVAPTAMFGFGNPVPQHRHFTYNTELGVVFQGSARTKLNLTGNACDPSGLNCVNAATSPTVQANIVAEQNKVNNKLSPFKYYPVISFGFGYRF